jgi:formamidopyrimidine-DNA glycosylase
MPELPEVETVARGLASCVVGARIRKVELCWPGCVKTAASANVAHGACGLPRDVREFSRRLTGNTVRKVTRRGKWLVLHLLGEDCLLIHLRMSGQLLADPQNCTKDRHTRALFTLELPCGGKKKRTLYLRFRDMRKFGRLLLTDRPADLFARLGPEPLSRSFTAARLASQLTARGAPIKNLLLDQQFLAGVGNIYANEALWRARIHPLKRGRDLTPDEVKRLYRCIRSALRDGIAAGGTTLSKNGLFRAADGQSGGFEKALAVYGRSGQNCMRCHTPIERCVVAQRSTFFCPCCQPAPQ